MRTVTLLFNVVSCLFTGVVVVTDGMSAEPAYVALMLLMVLMPVLTIYALVVSAAGAALASTRAAAIGNLVLLVFIGWALVDRYPHPDEPGFVPYVVVMLLTPVLSILALSGAWLRPIGKGIAS